MGLMSQIASMGHEQVVFCHDEETQLRAIIAIHDTTLGPALGGCRFWNYENEEEAVFDVLRLSKGMTYKAAIAGLDLGGGKSVIIGDPNKLKSESFFRRFGQFIESLNGKYISAEDVNIRVEDINIVGKETKHVVGGSVSSGGSGDPSPFTALGVYHGIRSCVHHRLTKDSLKNLRVLVQGCGSVARNLCRLLKRDEVELIVTDLNEELMEKVAKEYGARSVSPDDIFSVDADVFSPCALGGILNKNTISKLKAPIVAGGANNQLLDEQQDAQALRERDILYAPDYVINAGGLINVFSEIKGYNESVVIKDVEKIYQTLLNIFQKAESDNILNHQASDRLAEQRIEEVKKKKKK